MSSVKAPSMQEENNNEVEVCCIDIIVVMTLRKKCQILAISLDVENKINLKYILSIIVKKILFQLHLVFIIFLNMIFFFRKELVLGKYLT